MEADLDCSLEEGECSNDSDNNYTPLERPDSYSMTQPHPRLPVIQKYSESEEEVSQTDSDSDSDTGKPRCKKQKIKPKPRPRAVQRSKKYDIWSTRVQEDVLSETLNSCDVTLKDRSRDVESYDYTLGAKYYGNTEDDGDYKFEERKTNKRTASDRNNKKIRPGRRRSSNSEDKEQLKGKPRIILELSVNMESSNDEVAKDIANKLCEEKDDLILKIVNVFGKDRAIEVFEETRKIEAEGGMMIMNLTRRRTPGGVFLFLVRHHDHITFEQRSKIFTEDRQREKVILKQKKKEKLDKFRQENAAAKVKLLPDLLTRAELLATKPKREESDIKDVINPPPTPETDCHENSCDGMDSIISQPTTTEQTEAMDAASTGQRKLESYEDDFLDIGCSNEMDMF